MAKKETQAEAKPEEQEHQERKLLHLGDYAFPNFLGLAVAPLHWPIISVPG